MVLRKNFSVFHHFQDFLIYGTNKGCVKVRAFPKMKLIGNILEDKFEFCIYTPILNIIIA